MSVKKTLGTVGFIVFCYIAIVAVRSDPATAPGVLLALGGMVCGLFGIKTAGGVALQLKTKSVDAAAAQETYGK